jgi:hypothetical protein
MKARGVTDARRRRRRDPSTRNHDITEILQLPSRKKMHYHRFDTSDAFATWRAESHAVQEAYERWQQAAAPDAAIAYAAYRAALDREEMASQHFQSVAA